MCTVSWRAARDGYELWFNRDELHTRAPETPPARSECDGVAILAPRDGARGGTWLLANDHGVTICLLNDYANPWRPRDPRSRGEVVVACAAAPSASAAERIVRALSLERFAPFHLLTLAVDAAPLLLRWDGTKLTQGVASPPCSSSSFATAEVIAARVRRFREFADLAAYHHQHDSQAGAHSVLMRRADAATRSICHVCINAVRVRLDYAAVTWSEAGPTFTPSRHELPRSDRG